MFKRILIANRGEIAVRVIRACRELGIESVAVYSEADRAALHVREADYAVLVGPAPASQSYLQTEKILAAAKDTGADAIHPGYGFFSENAGFARAVEKAGLTFIGPPPDAIVAMGDKVESRKLMTAAGVPVVPGSPDTLETEEQVREIANKIGYPDHGESGGRRRRQRPAAGGETTRIWPHRAHRCERGQIVIR